MRLLKKILWGIILAVSGTIFIIFYRERENKNKKRIEKIIQKAEQKIGEIDEAEEKIKRSKEYEKMSDSQLNNHIRNKLKSIKL